MIKIIIRSLSALASLVSIAIVVVIGLAMARQPDAELSPAIVGILFMLYMSVLFGLVAFDRYHKSVASFLAWLILPLLAGHAYDAYDRNLFALGNEAPVILAILGLGFLALGFVREMPASRQLLLVAIVGIALGGYVYWFNIYQMAGKELEALDKRSETYQALLEGSDCLPALAQLTPSSLEPHHSRLSAMLSDLNLALPATELAIKNFVQSLNAVRSTGVEEIDLQLQTTKSLDFYSQTPFTLTFVPEIAGHSDAMKKILDGSQLIEWNQTPAMEQGKSKIEGKIFGDTDASRFVAKSRRQYCELEPQSIHMPPYGEMVKERRDNFMQICRQLMQNKPALDRWEEIHWMTRRVLEKAAMLSELARRTSNDKLKTLSIEMPVLCMSK